VSATDLLCQAIEQMLVAEFRYKGSWRSVEPHALGYNRRGTLTLCAFQLSGGSGKDWRDFHVDLMTDITISNEAFCAPRDGYNPQDSTLTNIIAAL
jgi:hypothetical protein